MLLALLVLHLPGDDVQCMLPGLLVHRQNYAIVLLVLVAGEPAIIEGFQAILPRSRAWLANSLVDL